MKRVRIQAAAIAMLCTCGICASAEENVRGDLNADGAFDQKDAILLSKWLCTEDVKLTNWKAADLNTDGKLTAADLTSMKRLLLSAPEEE